MNSEFMKAARDISNRLQWLEAEYHAAALDAYLVLEIFDPEMTRLTVEALGDKNNAATWLAEKTGVLCGKKPWEYLATGRNDELKCYLRALNLGASP